MMEQMDAFLRELTLDELREWAGAKIVGRGQSYIGNVSGLSRTNDGALAAWVSGSKEYATSVGLDPDGELEYLCTCPYDDGPCKHAVAVLLAAAKHLKQKKNIPPLTEGDDLYLALFDDSDDDSPNDGDWMEEDEEDWEPEPVPTISVVPKKGKSKVIKIFDRMSKEELIAMLVDLTCRYPEIERGMLEKEQLATGRVDKMVSALRQEIRNLTAEPAWYNHWKGEGSLPDYSHVHEQLRALLKTGHADAVLQLGEELWTLGNEQVGQSHDEGDTASEISVCMEVVLRAVPQTSLTPPNQLLWLIDRALGDEYSLLESVAKIMDGRRYTRAHWGEVADVLEARLNSMVKPVSSGFSDTYGRRKVLDMLLKANERSGRQEKIIPLLEGEAAACQCYVRLVDVLLSGGEREKTRQWCIRGFQCTAENAPGIAADLQKKLRVMAETEKNHPLVAAYRAQDFFAHSSRGTYTELRKAAEKAKIWPTVRDGVLRYLETGRRPDPAVSEKKTALWPLPAPEVSPPGGKTAQRHGTFPILNVLIDIAILEGRLEDAIAHYQTFRKTKRWSFETDKTVADAVAGTHPQVALDIWRSIVDGLIGQVKPKAYEEAAVYLLCMCKVYRESHRVGDWDELLSTLRREHRAKRRLLEVLDSLSGKKMVK